MKTEKEIREMPEAQRFDYFMELLGKLSPEDQAAFLEEALRRIAAGELK